MLAASGGLGGLAVSTSARPGPLELLTARERELLTLLASGHGTAAVARHLPISTKTAANHLSHVLTRVGAADRPNGIWGIPHALGSSLIHRDS